MNDFFYSSIIKDRQREVNKIVQENRINSHFRDSASNRLESSGQVNNLLDSWHKVVIKRFKSIFDVTHKENIKAQG